MPSQESYNEQLLQSLRTKLLVMEPKRNRRWPTPPSPYSTRTFPARPPCSTATATSTRWKTRSTRPP